MTISIEALWSHIQIRTRSFSRETLVTFYWGDPNKVLFQLRVRFIMLDGSQCSSFCGT